MSREKKWTPGPWRIRGEYNNLKDEIGVDGLAVATVWTRQAQIDRETRQYPEFSEGVANAHLIKAAPDLVVALEGLVPHTDEGAFRSAMEHAPCHRGVCRIDDCKRCGRQLKAIKALAKAYGESE